MTPPRRPKPTRTIKRNLEVTHRFYQITGGYRFLVEGLRKLGVGIAIFIAVFWAINNYLIDFKSVTEWVTQNFPWGVVILTQLASEIVTGAITPELFLIWAKSTDIPWLTVFALATASYAGGIISYLIGVKIRRFPKVQEWANRRFATLFTQIRRFGGLLIFIAALTPLPFPPVCLISGTVGFRFKWFLQVSLIRYARFAIYGAIIFGLF